MDKYELTKGEGRNMVNLSAHSTGNDLVLCMYNDNSHIGAVAVGEYDHKEQRASTSVITRLGHKDDAVAQEVAHSIAKQTKRPVCAIVGIHIDNATESEINQILNNARVLTKDFISKISKNLGRQVI
jgi:hypothetical protein